MKDYISERVVSLAHFNIDNKATVRCAAKKFGISKSTVHKDVADRLYYINKGLFEQVKPILAENKACRHLRGGMATKEKYLKARSAGKLDLTTVYGGDSPQGDVCQE